MQLIPWSIGEATKQIAAFLCAVVLCGSAFAQQFPAYKDGEDGVNRTRPGNHKPGKMDTTKDRPKIMSVAIDGVNVAGVHTSTDFNALREEGVADLFGSCYVG